LRAALDGQSSSSASQRGGGSGGTATLVAHRLDDEERAAVIRREVQSWLGRLVLLYGVPFRYLIPEEKMLPKESIRFFYLDPIWIQCLIQGACTVGNTSQSDVLIDEAINETVQPNQPEGAERPGLANEAAAGIRSQLRNQCEGVPLPQQNGTLHWPLTGFLLRSAVVDGWRGLEVMAYRKVESETEKGQLLRDKGLSKEQIEKLESDGVAPLAPLRIEQLSQDVMLGLFNGKIAQLVIRQPQEGLHFGLEPTDGLDAGYIKRLREFGYKCPKRAGEVLDKGEIDLSKGCLIRCKRVVAVGCLAEEMKRRLSDQSQLRNETFTSAEFGVQMIEAPGEFTFKPNQDAEG
jgi:hypothetical protein